QAEDGIRDATVTGVQTCALPISRASRCTSTRSTRRLRAEVRAASNVAVHISPRVGRAIPRLLWGLLPLAAIDVVLFVIPMVFMEIGRASCRERVSSAGLCMSLLS